MEQLGHKEQQEQTEMMELPVQPGRKVIPAHKAQLALMAWMELQGQLAQQDHKVIPALMEMMVPREQMD